MKFLVAAAPCGIALAGGWIGHGWIGHGAYKIALLALPFIFGCRLRIPSRIAARHYIEALVSGLLLGGLAFAILYSVLPRMIDPAEVRAGFDSRYHYTPRAAIVTGMLIITINALLEEWFYRGFLNDHAGPALSVFFFGLQHTVVLAGIAGILPAIVAGLAVMPAALIWTWHARRSNSRIAVPFVSHMFADLVLITGGLWMLGYF